MKPAIEIKGIGKKYLDQTRRHDGFRLALPGTVATRALSPTGEFWALKDVSFSVEPGQVVGVVGRNGSGKSTLFRILSRITMPSSGEAIVRGRMSSLLEIGAGFHPELTGRENVYLNGAILGMKRREIDEKLDAIVAFSEIEKFLDFPVKRYSSGMYLRLAFSVASHLEQDILLLDEVLAVGDAPFRAKCLEKIRSLAQSGKTILLVSHSQEHIEKFCQRAVYLKEGIQVLEGDAKTVLARYQME